MLKIIPIISSANRKTGAIVQTYSGAQSCPQACPFKGNGCYAECGMTRFTFARATSGEGLTARELISYMQQNTAAGQLIRHNIAGDIARAGTSEIDGRLINNLIAAYDGRRAYTYTHCAQNAHNTALIIKAMRAGFVINQSCETVRAVDKAMAAGIPAVLAVTSYKKGMITPEGRPVILCPAQIEGAGVTCSRCGLCANSGRKSAIAFLVHGTGAKKAAAAIEAAVKYDYMETIKAGGMTFYKSIRDGAKRASLCIDDAGAVVFTSYIGPAFSAEIELNPEFDAAGFIAANSALIKKTAAAIVRGKSTGRGLTRGATIAINRLADAAYTFNKGI